jgi:hypothetical protein
LEAFYNPLYINAQGVQVFTGGNTSYTKPGIGVLNMALITWRLQRFGTPQAALPQTLRVMTN